MYIQKVETLRTYAVTWKFFTRVDLNLYEDEHKRLRNEIGKMFKVCTELGNTDVYAVFQLSVSCEDSVKQMENIADDIENTWKIRMVPEIQKIQNHNFNLRVKYQRTFEEIIKTPNASQSFSSFIDVNEDLVPSNATKVGMELGVVNRKSKTLTNMLSRALPKEIKNTLIKHLLQDLLSYSTTTFLDYKVNQQNIYDALATGNILSSTSLLSELDKLRDTVYHKKLDLPLSHDELSTKFYQYVNIQSMIMNKTLFFVYMLPLVEPTEFQLYQLQPYPRRIEESIFELVLPDITRIALNKQQKRYFDMDTVDLKNCYISANYVKLCELSIPTLSTENSGSCTVELLTKSEIPNCKFRMMALYQEIWFSLILQNSWLFVFPRAIEISITCNGVTDQRFMKGAGTLSISSNCHVNSEHIDIIAYAKEIRSVERVFLSAEMTIDWKEIIQAIKLMKRNITRNTLPKFIKKNSIKLLRSASTSIEEFVLKNETIIKIENEHRQNQNIKRGNVEISSLLFYGINATISLIISAIFLVITLLCNHCKRKNRAVVRHVKYVRERKSSDETSS